MVNFKIMLDKRRKRKDNRYPLSLYVYGNGSVRFISLKHYFTEEQYEFIEKNKTQKTIEFNTKLNGYLIKAQQIKSSLHRFDFRRFKKLYNKNSVDSTPNSVSIQDAFNEVVEKKMKEGSVKTAITYKHALSCLTKFSNVKRIEDIDSEYLSNFQSWYIREHGGKLNSSVGWVLRNLRAVINRLITERRLPPDYLYPFGRNKFIIRNNRKPKRTLTKEEIETLVKLDDFTSEEERRARDIWLMQFYCNGINLKDLLMLRWEDKITSVEGEGELFVIKRQKTKSTNQVERFIRIPISQKISKLLDKYGDKNSPYVLGLLKEGMKEKEILMTKENFGKVINKQLDRIQKRLNLSIPLSNKIARDAYATTLRRNGVSIEVISQNLGHSSVLVTVHYLEDFGFNVINNSNDCLP